MLRATRRACRATDEAESLPQAGVDEHSDTPGPAAVDTLWREGILEHRDGKAARHVRIGTAAALALMTEDC